MFVIVLDRETKNIKEKKTYQETLLRYNRTVVLNDNGKSKVWVKIIQKMRSKLCKRNETICNKKYNIEL